MNNNIPSTLEEFITEVKKYPRNRLLHLCAAINALLRADEDPINKPVHDSLVRLLFPKEIAAVLLSRQGNVRFVFHRQQVLYVAKIAVTHGDPRDGIFEPGQFVDIGKVFLMAGDHFPVLERIPEPLDDKFSWAALQFIPIQESSGYHRFDHKIARSYRMLSDTAPKLRSGKEPYFDIPRKFEDLTGVNLLTFQSLLFGSLTKFREFDFQQHSADPRNYGLNRGWFAKTKISPDVVDRFLDLVSDTPEGFAAEFAKSDWGSSDFTPFRNKPFFRDGDVLFLLDFAFLAEKFEAAPFWIVHNSLTANADKEELHSFWGRVFERYCCDILLDACKAGINSVQESPIFERRADGQLCDAIVCCDDAVALLEIKGATFSSRSKYGSDYKQLKKELDLKLVRKPDGTPKAAYQLKRAIELSCSPDQPQSIVNIDLSRASTVYPVVITRDDIGSTVGVNAFLQYRFNEAFNRKGFKKSITPIFCLDAEDIERLSAYLNDTSLTDLLHAHYKANRGTGKYLMNPFFASNNNSLINQKGMRQPAVPLKAWKDLALAAIEQLGLTDNPA